jgi:hypothetical protein
MQEEAVLVNLIFLATQIQHQLLVVLVVAVLVAQPVRLEQQAPIILAAVAEGDVAMTVVRVATVGTAVRA